MPLFQSSVITKHLQSQNKEIIALKWESFKNHFHNPKVQEEIKSLKEEQYQGEFLEDFFVKILGYTKPASSSETKFNLTTEYKNIKDSKKADGAIIVNDAVKAVIELKGTNTTDLGKIEVQAFGYKNNQPECTYIITSNFEKLRFYIDNAIEHQEFNLFTLTEKEFELLYLCLAYENIEKDIPKKIKDQSISQEDAITKKLYHDYSLFKRELHQSLVKLNPQFDALTLFQKSQKLLDRFLFLFFAEDRQLLPPNSVRMILDQWKKLQELDEPILLYNRFKKYFGYLNTGFKGKQYDVYAYNGGLFLPDEVLDNITIDDDLLYLHTLKLSEYDFISEVDVNILGHIFENSLNELDEIKAQLAGETVDKTKTKRKKDGVFYTPKYITKYIVENTVGKLCEEKKGELQIIEEEYIADKKRQKKTIKALIDKLTEYRNWLLQLTICDPACGSGAFLNQALDFLINEHKYIDELQAKLFGDAMVLSDVEKSILENNLFGVDLNEESVEIAKLSLWLRTAQPNRKLNDLNNNIKCGNSLIDDVAIAGDKAFNWQQEFPQIFEKGGFDVVIGNPPYFNIDSLGANSKIASSIQSSFPNIWQDKSDILFYFIAKAIQISKYNVGFIVSNAFMFSNKAMKLRNYILKNAPIERIINFEKYMVFQDASITTTIINLNKKKQDTTCLAYTFKDKKYTQDYVSEKINNDSNFFKVDLKKDTVFALVEANIAMLNHKIDSNYFSLNNLFKIGSGMQTAANKQFLFKEYPNKFPKECVKKRLSGDIIDKYYIKDVKEYILYFEQIENFENLPKAIQVHLIENKEFLENRADKKRRKTSRWWNYTFPMHKDYYHLDKIWCSYRAKENIFCFDDTREYIGLTNTTVIFDTNKEIDLKYLIALLNSSTLNFRYKSIGKQTGSGVFEYFENGVGKLPIPNISKLKQKPFIISVNNILLFYKKQVDYNKLLKKVKAENNFEREILLEKELEQINQNIQNLNYEIDKMVYELYGLTQEEIEIVEGS